MPVPQSTPPLGRRLLRDDVHDRLRDAIVDGTFAPGEQLRDEDLADWLGVSRTPVREALLRLAEAGLVVARPGRSTTVSDLDVRGISEARDVVAAMHRLATEIAVPHLTDTDLEAMRDANGQFLAALDAGDMEAALRADDAFHDVVVSTAANRALTAVLARFTPVLRRAERLRFSSDSARLAYQRHEAFTQLCSDRSLAAAAELAFDTWRSLPDALVDDAPHGTT